MSKRFVVGDIHGGARALKQVLGRCGFNKDEDLLISLGDLCDGWSESKQVVEELLTIRNLKVVMGNHDELFIQFMRTGEATEFWTKGCDGQSTLESYSAPDHKYLIPADHAQLFNDMQEYVVLDDLVFVHAGLHAGSKMENQRSNDLRWDRTFVLTALREQKTIRQWRRIYLGHTPTSYLTEETKPLLMGNVIDVDTGAGWDGCLTVIDVDSEEVWQSDPLPSLYPDEKGRMG